MAASLFGTLGFLSRTVAELGMGAVEFVAWRAGLATLVLIVLGLLLGPRGAVGRLRQASRRRQLALLVTGLLGALLNIAIFIAFQRTAIALVLICLYTFPAMVTLAAVPLYGDRLERRRVIALLVSSAGLVLVLLAPAFDSAGGLLIDPLGVALALFAAACQAAFVLIAGRGFEPLNSRDVATFLLAGALVVSSIVLLASGQFDWVSAPLVEPRLWPSLLAAGIFGGAIATVAWVAGIGVVGPARAAILMTVEPVVGVTLAALLLGERPVPLQLVGGAAVLAAAVLLQTTPGRAPVGPEAQIV